MSELACYVNLKGVNQEQWEKIYYETLDWVRKCPLPLVRQEFLIGEVSLKHVYTKNLVSKEGIGGEHWRIEGDEMSCRFGDPFCMYRGLDWVLGDYIEMGLSKHSVFYAEGENLTKDESAHGVHAWGTKKYDTEGFPYRLAMMVVGIWMESRFPGACFMQGGMNKGLAERVLDWMRTQSNEPLEMPVVLNEERLWGYLVGLYEDKQLAMRRFFALYKGERGDGYAFFLKSAYKRELMKMLAVDLANLPGLGALGGQLIVRRFLGATLDVEMLIELVDMANEAKGNAEAEEKTPFKFEDLLKELCKELVMVKPAEKECITWLDSAGLDENFMSLYMMLGGLRKYDPKIYISEDEVFEAFMYRMPKKGKRFRKILDKGLAKHGKLLKKYNKKMNRHEVNYNKEIKNRGFTEEDIEERNEELRLAEMEGIFIAAAKFKQKKFMDEEMEFRTIGEYLRKVYPKFAPRFPNYAAGLKERMFDLAHDIGLVFYEDALAELENLEDVKLLKMLCIFMCFNEGIMDNHKGYEHWFRHFFRHPRFWPLLLDDSEV